MIFLQHSQNCFDNLDLHHWPPDIRITNSTLQCLQKWNSSQQNWKWEPFKTIFHKNVTFAKRISFYRLIWRKDLANPQNPYFLVKSVLEPPCQVKFHPIQLNWKFLEKKIFIGNWVRHQNCHAFSTDWLLRHEKRGPTHCGPIFHFALSENKEEGGKKWC